MPRSRTYAPPPDRLLRNFGKAAPIIEMGNQMMEGHLRTISAISTMEEREKRTAAAVAESNLRVEKHRADLDLHTKTQDERASFYRAIRSSDDVNADGTITSRPGFDPTHRDAGDHVNMLRSLYPNAMGSPDVQRKITSMENAVAVHNKQVEVWKANYGVEDNEIYDPGTGRYDPIRAGAAVRRKRATVESRDATIRKSWARDEEALGLYEVLKQRVPDMSETQVIQSVERSRMGKSVMDALRREGMASPEELAKMRRSYLTGKEDETDPLRRFANDTVGNYYDANPLKERRVADALSESQRALLTSRYGLSEHVLDNLTMFDLGVYLADPEELAKQNYFFRRSEHEVYKMRNTQSMEAYRNRFSMFGLGGGGYGAPGGVPGARPGFVPVGPPPQTMVPGVNDPVSTVSRFALGGGGPDPSGSDTSATSGPRLPDTGDGRRPVN